MNIEEYRNYCLSLKAAEESTPFGPDTLVFKVMGKMFSACDIKKFESFNIKAKPEDVIERVERYHCVHPGYHMNKKHWVSVEADDPEVSDQEKQEWIKASYDLVVEGLSKKQKTRLKELL